ncbi:hypothetical protein PQX77_005209 [Marasmius sp. AFHP31]|nr:hypothetical protein PQX77_005209 [Marasmius sp. AFHP31]
MQQKILDAHAEKERQVIESRGPLSDVEDDKSGGIQLLCDRSAIDPVVYAILTSRSVVEPHPSIEELARSRRDTLVNSPSFQAILPTYLEAGSHFYLLEPVDSWLEDDGFRHTGDQAESFVIFKRLLGELGIPYRLIRRDMLDLEERVRFVLGSGENSEEVKGLQR